MNRLLSCLVLLLWVAVASRAAAQSTGFDIEGRYEVLQPPQLTETENRIEVVDVFWYGCPHCYTFLPAMEAYEATKPEYVEVRRLPAVFRESWTAHARAYYTAMLLGVADKTHRALFEEIHVQRNPTHDKESLAAFYERHGVDRGEFEKTYDSFAVESMVRKSAVMQKRYGITGTPSVVVNGKYRVAGQRAGGTGDMIAVVRGLVDKELHQVARDTIAATGAQGETTQPHTAQAGQRQAQPEAPAGADVPETQPVADKDREPASAGPSAESVPETSPVRTASPVEPAPPSVWQSRQWMLVGVVALVLIAIGGWFASRRLRRPR